MREWIEAQEAKRRDEVRKDPPRVGDFVNDIGWFGDVWAEVIAVRNYEDDMARYAAVTVVRYDKAGVHRWKDDIYFGSIRKIAKAETFDRAGLVHTRAGKISYGRRTEWPEITDRLPWRGSGRDSHLERHPDA